MTTTGVDGGRNVMRVALQDECPCAARRTDLAKIDVSHAQRRLDPCYLRTTRTAPMGAATMLWAGSKRR